MKTEPQSLEELDKALCATLKKNYDDDLSYWKERCRLAEAMMDGYTDEELAWLSYNKFITDNGKKEY